MIIHPSCKMLTEYCSNFKFRNRCNGYSRGLFDWLFPMICLCFKSCHKKVLYRIPSLCQWRDMSIHLQTFAKNDKLEKGNIMDAGDWFDKIILIGIESRASDIH